MLDAHKRGAFRLLNNGPVNKEVLRNCLRDPLSQREPIRDGGWKQGKRWYQSLSMKSRLDMSGFEDRKGLFWWM